MPVRLTSPLLAVLLLGALAAATGCARQPQPPSPPHPALVEQGAELFARYCASCHGLGGRGDGPVAGALTTPLPDLTRIAVRRGGDFPGSEVALQIDGRFAPAAHGTREMPVWGRRFGEELPESELQQPIVRGRILVLVSFLEAIQRTD